ncbi:DUF2931 family protein [Pseudomonas japonica]|uniref:DUF2931 family protein n=1 Tax=Pseudomonas japonica TaxID=256466 RepID=UPI0015E495C9|nr:DUF2931 family protein [Pseudomonas japonica]MBA1291701.1 DUF2931 family protein [Pseudomonas japonica]
MNSLGRLLLLVTALALVSCAKGPHGLPFDAWWIGVFARPYMDVWIETVDVADARGRVYRRAMSGVASMGRPSNLKADPRGWPSNPTWGKGKHVLGADLPLWIYVRWQSLVEPRTYEGFIPIDAATRKAMAKGERVHCDFGDEWITDHRYAVALGLAPGGVVRMWISGRCLSSIPIARVQGRVVEAGPYNGQSDGHYYPLDDVSKAYIEKYGVPYGSW